ncbi:DUF6155 family protein [Marinifilum caeruleilacunae]|uniref:Uncharacterized protein n=1 Tax=Marinifilum caeruleilacunae TaxID=2499076 RepID=A0ABX1WQA0_9BACT|nr:DUF6155 family protein [Marinifilum caeruleilacunae]NOU58186.1 hypothetical protein [Marinifilum caeruleilacunae]
MSKKDLKEYIHHLSKEHLEDQILDLYTRFKEVKEFYDFAFNPKENKLMEECKFKISKEYFPVNGRKAKMRRSVAQGYIRHFKRLGVESSLIADIMLYNIEVAQTYTTELYIKQESFYKSMLKSFQEAVKYIRENGIEAEFKARLNRIVDESIDQRWMNREGFQKSYH